MISKLSDTTQSKISIKNLEKNLEELEDCFYKDLEFGTGGMRGVMGVGTNRINRYTLGRNTQGVRLQTLNNNEKLSQIEKVEEERVDDDKINTNKT